VFGIFLNLLLLVSVLDAHGDGHVAPAHQSAIRICIRTYMDVYMYMHIVY
jgi:hypothetical protein